MVNLTAFHQYLVKRSIYGIFTVFAVSFMVFAITQMLPGNAALMILGEHATEERIAVIEQQLGLNQPWYIQYFDWITGIIAGDWGTSLVLTQPVATVIETRFINSLQLTGATLVMVTLVGIPFGALAAIKRDTFLDNSITAGSYLGISVPEFVTGSVLILVFAGPVFQVFPSGGYVSLSEGVIPWLYHIALPVITLTILLLAHIVRLTRSSMIQTLQSEYVRTARLKGLPERVVLVKHALRNGLMPTITVLALDLGYLMGSIVIVEEVFAYPGIGRLIVFAIQNRDLPVLQMAVLVVATTYVFANFAADMLYSYLDPRIEYGGS